MKTNNKQTNHFQQQLLKKTSKWLLPFCLFAFLPLTLSAQEEVILDDDDDEIIVTDEEGNEVEIEFPEAMNYDNGGTPAVGNDMVHED